MEKKKIVSIVSMCFLAASVALMWLPSGVAMRFVSDPGPPMEYVTFHYSYISGMPIGYGNWFPDVTVILSFAVLLLLLAKEARKPANGRNLKKSVLICLSICIIASPLSWLIFGGAYSITVIGISVLALHAAALAMQIIFRRMEEF